jgi:hypothetical protein
VRSVESLLAITGVWWKKSRAEGKKWHSGTVGLGEMYEVLALADLTPL